MDAIRTRPCWQEPRLMLEPTLRKDRTEVTFILPADTPPGPVSVVGDFKDWQPGVHTLRPPKDGKRAVTVELPSESTHSFRYLAAGDHWFNDESAGDQDGPNSRLHT
ncbi:isoamylase early set domain-containing protein [Streptomyces sp. IBSNAI002]|uniref:isoamylase early set domain-containing protein n=1 Tax=Streptomyces sp. IBSNAI002 TaxID=3457500 RepID=UPI003FD424EF